MVLFRDFEVQRKFSQACYTQRMLSIEQSCYWHATRSGFIPSPPLEGNCDADFAIIGAGFTGLWTAFFLKLLDPSKHVVVLDQGCAGYGASGRNAGIVSTTIDHSHALAVAHFGEAEAEKLARIGLKNIDELAQFATDCDFERREHLQVALSEAQIEEGKHTIECATQLGLNGYSWLSAEQVQTEIRSPLYKGAVSVAGGAIVNPIKLIDKLKREASRLGVILYEQTPVIELGGNRVRTAGGFVSCKKIILGTDAYTHHLFPQVLKFYIPLYDYVLVSDPLTEDQRHRIGWRNRQSVTDGRTFFNYYRLTADNRILWGTSEAKYYSPNRVDAGCDHSQSHYQDLRQSFLKHFPHLSDLKFPYGWGGPIASTTRLTPFFGSAENGRILYGLGYTGHGLGSTRIAGKILTHMALSRDSELLQLMMVKNKPLPYPPEPMRAMAVQAVTRSLQGVDAGGKPDMLLKFLDVLGVGFSS